MRVPLIIRLIVQPVWRRRSVRRRRIKSMGSRARERSGVGSRALGVGLASRDLRAPVSRPPIAIEATPLALRRRRSLPVLADSVACAPGAACEALLRWHLGERNEQGRGLRCARIYREARTGPSRAPRAHSPCWIALNPGRAPFWPPRGARRNLRMCFRLIRAVSTRLAHQSYIDLAFCAQPCWRLRGWPCALEGKGGLTRSSLGERGAVPAG